MFYAHWKHAQEIIKNYKGDLPLHHFLKNYFKYHKQCGSKDRKNISQIVFLHFRLAYAFKDFTIQQSTALAEFVIENKWNDSLLFHQKIQALSTLINESVEAKFEAVEKLLEPFSWKNLLPFESLISPEINLQNYCFSFFYPSVFYLKIIDQHFKIKNTLAKNNIEFEELKSDILSIKTNQNISQALQTYNNDYYIQDLSCQQILDFLTLKNQYKIWDCCSGSGGKSILIKQKYPDITIWNSDNRPSVLKNLSQRFTSLNIAIHKTFEIDLSIKTLNHNLPLFDSIIADVPCTGSGTWHSNPEQKNFFNPNTLKKHVLLQQKIVENTLSYLKENGQLIYITCSIFKDENENQLLFFTNKLQLRLKFMTYINADKKTNADIIFIAIFEK